VTKRFGPVVALRDVSLQILPGAGVGTAAAVKMCRSVVVPAAAVLSSSYGVMFSPR